MKRLVNSVIDRKSPPAAERVRLLPTPTATQPALIHPATFSRLTPTVGISEARGIAALTALTNAGFNVSPGHSFTISTLTSNASMISRKVAAPGRYRTRYRFHSLADSIFNTGETTN